MFDESPHLIAKPMLDAESLRRLAWSVYYLDATMDGGHYGFTAIPDGAFTIPLPCDEKPFLRHQSTSKEYMQCVTAVEPEWLAEPERVLDRLTGAASAPPAIE
ncbi:MAG: hypothetical protein EOO77_29265 [Oxalobacteraceae bacterium]|nr:MAG: hypothetical protein EOO77_29265 [Oxalobacteraceae bacterium]